MEINKDELAEQMYRSLDIATDGEFDLDQDEFIRIFKRVLKEYALVPISFIIEK